MFSDYKTQVTENIDYWEATPYYIETGNNDTIFGMINGTANNVTMNQLMQIEKIRSNWSDLTVNETST